MEASTITGVSRRLAFEPSALPLGYRPLVDSRETLLEPSANVFFAFRGRLHDGHDFVLELYQRGLRHFVIELWRSDWAELAGASFWETDSVNAALLAWAAWHRANKAPDVEVLGITGSNGKTIVKEWLARCLMPQKNLAKNPKSYNSQIGLPLSLLYWQDPKAKLGIFEVGISERGEMAKLAAVLDPNLGIFTCLGSAHDQGFASREEKLLEKLKLFKKVKTLICSADSPWFDLMAQTLGQQRLMAWGQNPKAKVPLWLSKETKGQSRVYLIWQGENLTFDLPFEDKASIENACHVLVAALYLGAESERLKLELRDLQPLPMRLALHRSLGDSILIDDSYSNDFQGLQAALQTLQEQHSGKRRKALVLSDFGGGGGDYQSLGPLFHRNEIAYLWTIGPNLAQWQDHWPSLLAHRHFDQVEDLIQLLETEPWHFQNLSLLVKGSRRFGLERVVERLTRQRHGTRMELSLTALRHNLQTYRALLPNTCRLMVMVKAFAYGSGGVDLALILERLGVDYFGVAYCDEGSKLRIKGVQKPIMVMNPEPHTYGELLRQNLEPTIYDLSMLRALGDYVRAETSGLKQLGIHIEFNTGMQRLGLGLEAVGDLATLLKDYADVLVLRSCFSHLVGADEADLDDFSLRQIEAFDLATGALSRALSGQKFWRHILNSAGIVRWASRAAYDMVRLGIGLQGFDPRSCLDLRPVAALKTHIAQVHDLALGDSVGYGRRGYLGRGGRVATISLGYADGFLRKLGNGAIGVLVRGLEARTIGNVCMDMAFIDVSHIPEVQAGDEVLVFGPDYPLERLAKALDTIPYEVLTLISPRIPRIFYED